MSTYNYEKTSTSILKSFAIDGPTAVGKSVIGRGLASTLGLFFCDTGLMYRAATLAVLNENIKFEDESAIVDCVRRAAIDLVWDVPEIPLVLMHGENVSTYLREPKIDESVSSVARLPEVRSILVNRQRTIAGRSPVIMVGRDIGKVILPEARAKVFMDASLDERARRRLSDEISAGRAVTFRQVRESIASRDKADNTGHRSIEPEQAATDAVLVDTDGLTENEVIIKCVKTYEEANERI